MTVLTAGELRELFLFADLADEQLAWVAEHSRIGEPAAGTVVAAEGEPAEDFFVLLSGTLTLTRQVGSDEVEIVRTDHRGVYAGATQFHLGDQVDQSYPVTLRAVTDCRFLVLPAAEFTAVFAAWFPMAVHLLQGMFLGLRNADELVGQRERLLALGKLTAGLTHELNNPAAAAARATAALRERVAAMRHTLAMLADGSLDADALRKLTELQETLVGRIGQGRELSAVQAADAEDELGAWLDEQAVQGGWELAAEFVTAGVDLADLDRLAASVDPSCLGSALRWLADTIATENLLNEITDATTRISALIGAAKQYSQLDRAPHQDIDVHDGLEATVTMLAGKIGPGVRIERDYDRTLPLIPAYPAELNQV